MFENLKKTWNKVKAWGAGVSAYVTTLFTTPGEFSEAQNAASQAYDRAYARSMGASNPSIGGAIRQMGRGDAGGAIEQAGRVIGQAMDYEPAVNAHIAATARAAERQREEARAREATAALNAQQDARRKNREAHVTGRIRAKYGLQKKKSDSHVGDIDAERDVAKASPEKRCK